DANLDLEDALATQVVVPIESGRQEIGGFVPEGASTHVGGAAIVLRNLEPRLTAEELETRIHRFTLLPTTTGPEAAHRAFDVELSPAGDTAVVLVSDPQLVYSTSDQRWRDELVAPMWRLTNESMAWTSYLQRVTNFDPAVAGDAHRDAIIAL